jgi:hypothetical protein
MTGAFDAAGRQLTRRELLGLANASAGARVHIELLDKDGTRITTLAPEFQPEIAALVVAARIMGPDET